MQEYGALQECKAEKLTSSVESEKASPRKRDTIRRLKLRRNKTKSQLMR